eukprot:m.111626 g.111626  ORF g.111626 m.111626 type:complete len:62 (+) comp13453_c0_seq2:272-457(+)
MLVCGGDLLQTIPHIKDDGQPLWIPDDVDTLLSRNGVVCLERPGTDLSQVSSITHNINPQI